MLKLFIARFAFSTLLLLSSTNLFAQIVATDPANQPVHVYLDTMVVKGLTQNDFKEFPTTEYGEVTYEKGEKKISVQYSAYFDYSSVVRQVILCKIQASYDKTFEKEGPTKEELTPVIIKHITEQVNKLLALKREPLFKVANMAREGINRETAILTDLRKQQEALVRKAGRFSPQAAQELKSKFWTQSLDLQSEIAGNNMLFKGLQSEIALKSLPITNLLNMEQKWRQLVESRNGQNLAHIKIMRRTEKQNKNVIEASQLGSQESTKAVENIQKEIADYAKAHLEGEMYNKYRKTRDVEETIEDIKYDIMKIKETKNEKTNPEIEEAEAKLRQFNGHLDDVKMIKKKWAEAETTSNPNMLELHGLRSRLSETRIANDVLNVKYQFVKTAYEEVANDSEGNIELENKRSDIKHHERALDILNEKLTDTRMKIDELERQSFELVPLK